jgi:putative endonuclease
MSYFVYILRSIKDSSFYIGYTNNLDRRLEEHNKGESRYTRKKKPWKIFYFEIFRSKSEALKRERFLKKQKNTSFYMKLKEKSSLVR